MKTLFIDTSNHKRMAAVIINNEIKSLFVENNDNYLAEIMLNKIIQVLDEAKIILKELDNIMVVNGPGSFTGVRVGVTIAKTLAYTQNIKIIPISSLELLASNINITDNTISLIDARRGYVYAGGYDNNLNNIIEDKYVKLEDITKNKEYTFVSFDRFDNLNTIEPKIDLLKLVNKHLNDEGVNPHSLNPNYLKLTEAEENLGHK